MGSAALHWCTVGPGARWQVEWYLAKANAYPEVRRKKAAAQVARATRPIPHPIPYTDSDPNPNPHPHPNPNPNPVLSAGPLVKAARAVGLMAEEEADGWSGEPTAWAARDSLPQKLSEITATRLAGFKQWVAPRAA